MKFEMDTTSYHAQCPTKEQRHPEYQRNMLKIGVSTHNVCVLLYMCLNAWCITILKFGCLGAQTIITYHRVYLNILLVWFKVGVPNAGSLLDSVLRSHCGQ